ncbi:DUF6098 family protein [Amycolatopsis jiangsuensis]|uniref:Uncharacterized protein n=1 Tax=Amycolatopsis jiangsuensis TaxID=1181879 RepID=A0A840J696_9PSEU|nr:DUF6098 family protein [Amycolatopsis jiangsuensis]MBB4689219.1 hypothetical protein [Amycolatopsis jiangsuensis]
MKGTEDRLPTIRDFPELVDTFRQAGEKGLFVRWSRGPEADLRSGQESRDGLTGAALPGLSANSLKREPWWRDRSARLWLARRLYDYQHLRDLRGPGVRPWLLRGRELARGPDNEPLVVCEEPIAWIADDVLREARRLVRDQGAREWGPMDRRP